MKTPTNSYATWITAPHHHDLPLSSSIPTEDDWLEPDKEEFQHAGQKSETKAEITLHVDVVFELTLIPASCWLQGFTGLANNKCLCKMEYRKHRLWARVSWISQWSQCTLGTLIHFAYRKSLHHILTLVFCWEWLYFLLYFLTSLTPLCYVKRIIIIIAKLTFVFTFNSYSLFFLKPDM